MPIVSTRDAAERLAHGVEKSPPNILTEIYAELFPERRVPANPSAADLAQHIRDGLEAEELVDLWNVIFPEHRNVWYDELSEKIHYNEEAVGYA